ncbi:hypothetical protein TNCV_424091 [Trichonephila clavipes]|nr:hypothetical protein TNCV_424091 [Trichonephila clavipes]
MALGGSLPQINLGVQGVPQEVITPYLSSFTSVFPLPSFLSLQNLAKYPTRPQLKHVTGFWKRISLIISTAVV